MRNHVLSEDLRYEYAYQQIYLRSVEVTGLRVPARCPVEAMAFGMISCSQASWAQLLWLVAKLPGDSKERWAEDPPPCSFEYPAKRFTTLELWPHGCNSAVCSAVSMGCKGLIREL